ncbi:MAG: hypothetical protein AABX12_01740 [Nanoarchaeota archaeon]
MTLVIGIRTNRGPDCVILASDRQFSEIDEEKKLEYKRPIRKVYYGETWAMGDAGGGYSDVRKFYHALRQTRDGGTGVIARALKQGIFEEVLSLNRNLTRRDGVTFADTHSFVLATRKPRVALRLVDEFGNIKSASKENDFEYICVGNGDEAAEGCIEQQLATESIDRDNISADVAIGVALNAVFAASRLASVGLGYDLVIMEKNSLIDWGAKNNKALKRAQSSQIREMTEHYKRLNR